jgi:hypothetical protein
MLDGAMLAYLNHAQAVEPYFGLTASFCRTGQNLYGKAICGTFLRPRYGAALPRAALGGAVVNLAHPEITRLR